MNIIEFVYNALAAIAAVITIIGGVKKYKNSYTVYQHNIAYENCIIIYSPHTEHAQKHSFCMSPNHTQFLAIACGIFFSLFFYASVFTTYHQVIKAILCIVIAFYIAFSIGILCCNKKHYIELHKQRNSFYFLILSLIIMLISVLQINPHIRFNGILMGGRATAEILSAMLALFIVIALISYFAITVCRISVNAQHLIINFAMYPFFLWLSIAAFFCSSGCFVHLVDTASVFLNKAF